MSYCYVELLPEVLTVVFPDQTLVQATLSHFNLSAILIYVHVMVCVAVCRKSAFVVTCHDQMFPISRQMSVPKQNNWSTL